MFEPKAVVSFPAMPENSLAAAHQALSECDAVIDRLHKMCCEPERSPRMLAIKETIASVGAQLDASGNDPEAIDRALADLMDIGAQIGHLQVGCCAPARMPLYADALTFLTTTQLSINESISRSH